MYDTKTVEVWPEFANVEHDASNRLKSTTTIAHLMRHEAGLNKFSKCLQVSDMTTAKIKASSMSSVIQQEKPRFKPGSNREYHTISKGWIANEIVQRVDPSKRTIREFLRDEIAAPLGIEDELSTGVPERLWHKVAPMTHLPIWWSWR